MAADWRGWRLIVVNNQRFRWRAVIDPWIEEEVRVRCEETPSRLLIVHDASFAVPSLVRVWIEAALARGWLASIPQMELIGVDGSRCPLVAMPFGRAADSAGVGNA